MKGNWCNNCNKFVEAEKDNRFLYIFYIFALIFIGIGFFAGLSSAAGLMGGIIAGLVIAIVIGFILLQFYWRWPLNIMKCVTCGSTTRRNKIPNNTRKRNNFILT